MSRYLLRVAVLGVAAALLAPAVAAADQPSHRRAAFDLEAHRGGLAYRPESTLSSFGNGMRMGVSTLELDLQITKDGVAVVTHDRKTDARKCRDTSPATPGDPAFPYIGKYIKDLTLAQVKTLDCGSLTLPDFPQQEPVPGAQIPTLREVFNLVKRYRSPVHLNVETKVEAAAPQETAPREEFIQQAVKEIRAAGFLDRVTIESFDWGSLMRMHQVEPRLPLVALITPEFAQVGQPGKSPWLGGLDVDDFGGDVVKAAHSFGAWALSPVHGNPQNGKVTDPGYQPYTTKAMVDEAHGFGMKVIPWTVDDPATMNKLIDDGVDGMITDYPDRLRAVMRERGFRLPEPTPSPFDIQAHRGGRAYRPENTLAAFRWALANPDISTLELDTVVTRDGQLIVSHDRKVNGAHCVDTHPAWPNDPQFPYVGKVIHQLTVSQLETLDCGSKTLPQFPQQQAVPGEHMALLRDVLRLVRSSGRQDIGLNVETKISPLAPAEDASPREHARKLVRLLDSYGLLRRSTVQSFDWRTLIEARRFEPRTKTVALVWQYGPKECASLADECSLEAVYGDPSVKSPWTAGLDWWQVKDLGRLVRMAGASVVSANWQVHDPNQPVVSSTDDYLKQDPAFYHGPDVAGLHADGVQVIPYTIDDPQTMQHVIDLGVDGIISDDPLTLIAVAKRNGLR
jgi:glycerophosphoryl diester phosphodiesterase